MAKYIEKDALLAKIKKRRDAALTRQKNLEAIGQETVLNEMVAFELNRIISLVDTLEVKEVNLEEKARQLSQKYFPDEENIWARSNIEARKCKSACLEMVEWLKAQKGE